MSVPAGFPFVENKEFLFDWPPLMDISIDITVADAALNIILLDTRYIPAISAVYRPVLADNESVRETAPTTLSVFHVDTSSQASEEDFDS